MKNLACLCTLLLALLFVCGAVLAAPIPTGPASWYDNVTGKGQRAIGMGGPPILNYQRDDSSWAAIVDDWQQVDNQKLWRSLNGPEAVFCDSVGNFHVRRGTHHLGLHTLRLIKFNRLDSTYQVLDATPAPDSVTVSGNRVVYWSIFYGINLSIINNARVFQESRLYWEFTQAARDSLAKLTPWANRLLMTVHEIDHDSLNATMPGLTAAGILTVDHLEILNENRVWAIQKTFLETSDSMTSTSVWKRVVLTGGKDYFLEGFNPVQTTGLPTGSLFHAAVIGYQTSSTSSDLFEGVLEGALCAAAPSSGVSDSITAYIYASQSHAYRYALYQRTAANATLVQCGASQTCTNTSAAWISKSFPGATITEGVRYLIGAEAPSADGSIYIAYKAATSADTNWISTITWDAASCESPLAGTTYKYANFLTSIYLYYTDTWGEPYIGCRRYTPNDIASSTENVINMATMTASEDGVVDSLGFVVAGAAAEDFDTRMALYKINASSPPPDSIKDSTVVFTVTAAVTATYSKPVIVGANLYADEDYGVAIWGMAGAGNPTARGTSADTICVGNGVIKEYRLLSKTWSGNPWPDTLNATPLTGYLMAYIVYHTGAAPPAPTYHRRCILIGGGK